MYSSSLQLVVPSVSAKLELLKGEIFKFIDANTTKKSAEPVKILDKK